MTITNPDYTPWRCEWCERVIDREPDLWSCDSGPQGFPVCSRRCMLGHERFVGFKRGRQMPHKSIAKPDSVSGEHLRFTGRRITY